MKTEITRLVQDKSQGIEHSVAAPSLVSALRMSAEVLAVQLRLSGKKHSSRCLCKYILGNVDARITDLGDRLIVKFENKHGEHFATVKVIFED